MAAGAGPVGDWPLEAALDVDAQEPGATGAGGRAADAKGEMRVPEAADPLAILPHPNGDSDSDVARRFESDAGGLAWVASSLIG
jgi:hypothetical protein